MSRKKNIQILDKIKFLVFIFIALGFFGCGVKISHSNPKIRKAFNFKNKIVYKGKFGCNYSINSFFDELNNLSKEIITFSDAKTLEILYSYVRHNELDSVTYKIGNRELVINYQYENDSKSASIKDTLFYKISKPHKKVDLYAFEKKLDQEIFKLLELPLMTNRYHLPISGCDDDSLKILDSLYFANVQQIYRPAIRVSSGIKTSYLFYINQNSQNSNKKTTLTYFKNGSKTYLVEKTIESKY